MTDIPALRLAFREEGRMWNCYLASLGTMEGSIWIGSIHMRAIAVKQQRKEQFMRLMKGILADMIKEIGGGDVAKWDEKLAPEHERTKK